MSPVSGLPTPVWPPSSSSSRAATVGFDALLSALPCRVEGEGTSDVLPPPTVSVAQKPDESALTTMLASLLPGLPPPVIAHPTVIGEPIPTGDQASSIPSSPSWDGDEDGTIDGLSTGVEITVPLPAQRNLVDQSHLVSPPSFPPPEMAEGLQVGTTVGLTSDAKSARAMPPSGAAQRVPLVLDTPPVSPSTVVIGEAVRGVQVSPVLMPAAPAAALDPVPLLIDTARDTLWLDRMAREIVAVADTQRQVRFALLPPHLGRVDVQVAQSETRLAVGITTQTVEAHALLTQHQGSLTEGLRALGSAAIETSIAQQHQGRENLARFVLRPQIEADVDREPEKADRPRERGRFA